jgi:hypothetical protein
MDIPGRLKDNRGSVLMWAVVMSLCIILVGAAYLILSAQFHKLYSWDLARIENIYTTNSGLKIGVINFRDNRPSGIRGTFWDDYFATSRYGYGAAPIGGGSRGLASWVNYVIWGAGNTASAGGEFAWLDSVSYGFGAETFADYLWLTNSEHDMTTGNALYWWQADTLDGRVHSNDTLFISAGQSYGPVFYKKVTSCQDDTKPPRNTYNYNLVFKSEFFPRSARIVFPDQADSVRRYARGECLIGSQATAPNKQYYIRFFDGNTFRVLERNRGQAFDTTYNVPGQGWQAPGVTIRRLPANGAIFVYGKLYIDAPKNVPGRSDLMGINGRVTIASSDTMIIQRNVFLACSDTAGRIPLSCDDALGLISENWLLMSRFCGVPVYPNRGALIVNAAIATLRGSMSVENIDLAPEFNSLFIHGSIAQLYRGIIHRGSLGNGHGFAQKDYIYDQRLALNPPPHFIPTGTYKEYYVE